MADDYTPDEEHMSVAWIEYDDAAEDINEAEAEFDRFIAKVRRDAAREALDGLAAAEHRATRAEAQSAIRGRAVLIYQQRARQAEAERDRWHSMWRQRGVKHLAAEKRATRAQTERDEWRQTALDERGAALDLLEQIKVRDKRMQAVLAVLGLEVGDA